MTACWKLPFQLSQPVSHIGLETAAPASQFLVSNISAKKMARVGGTVKSVEVVASPEPHSGVFFPLAVSIFGYLPCYA